MDGDDFREGIYALNTRRFGRVAELIIERLVELGTSRSQFHDLFDDVLNRRVEVKFSRVLKKRRSVISAESVLECIGEATSEERLVSFDSWADCVFDCNIQQIKRAEFDVLYYGLFFSDAVVIFHIESDQIGSQIYYSDRQHKGNVGEGQFHVNQKTLQIHLDGYHYRTLSYDELLALLTAE